MRRAIRRLILFTGTTGLLSCSSSGPTEGSKDPPIADPPALAATVAAQSGSDGYGGVGYAFSPASVALLVNGTVTWNNNTGEAHTVTFAGVQNALNNGTQYLRSFTAVGVYSYTCSRHAGMSGSVTVSAP